MSRWTERIIAGLLVLFLLAYVGYQATRYYSNPIRTETVYEYTVTKSLTTTGIAIREETEMEQQVAGIENYLYEDASRVSVGQTVAEFYASSTGDQNVKRIREIENELDMLRASQDSSVGNYSNAEGYNRDIRDQLGQLSAMSSTGQYDEISELRPKLTQLLNKKQVATSKTTNFNVRISQLESELQSLERTTAAQTITEAAAPVSGYFSRSVDGLEGKVTPELLEAYSVEEFQELIDTPVPDYASKSVGKMVLSQNWYFATVVSSFDVQDVRQGQSVELYLEQVGRRVPAEIYKVIDSRQSDEAVLLLQSNQMAEDVINLRVSNVVVHFQSYTGLRINLDAQRYQGEQRGVYILKDNVVRFKQVDPIYEESGFLLSRLNYTEVAGEDKSTVSLYDQVIVKGIDLYDGKTIQ